MKSIAFVFALFFACGALAQPYPGKPVKVVVPNAPGGATDLVARMYATKLAVGLNGSFFAENRPGAGGTLAAALVAKAVPDGYTLMVGTAATHGISVGTYPDLGYNPERDFVPAGLLGKTPMAIAARADLGVRTLPELIARAKKETLNVAEGNVMGILVRELLVRGGGSGLTSITYKGSASAVNDVLGGHLPIIVDTSSAIQPHVLSGKLVALGITSPAQSPLMPGVKTVAEQGMPGFEVTGWFMLFAPQGTPAAIVRQLNAELQKIATDADFQKDLIAKGIDPAPVGDPARLAEFVRTEHERWVRVAKEAKLKPE